MTHSVQGTTTACALPLPCNPLDILVPGLQTKKGPLRSMEPNCAADVGCFAYGVLAFPLTTDGAKVFGDEVGTKVARSTWRAR